MYLFKVDGLCTGKDAKADISYPVFIIRPPQKEACKTSERKDRYIHGKVRIII